MTVSMRAARLPFGRHAYPGFRRRRRAFRRRVGDFRRLHRDHTTCCEGLEGSTIDLTGGDVRLTASDDGLNATDASNDDNSDGGFRPNDFEAVEGVYIAVRGSTLWVDPASGDGLDSNGGLYVTGGTVTVCARPPAATARSTTRATA